MRIIDLTHTVTDAMPTYPGDPKATLRQFAAHKKDGYVDHLLSTGIHVGTHIDAPAHMIEGGKRIDELPLEMFSGRGVLIDAREKERIDIGVQGYKDIEKEDIVLFYTGWGEKFRSPEYFTDFPVLTEAVAKELVERKIKMVGMDTASPDRAPFAVHKILLGAKILIIENLANLDKLLGKDFSVQAYPLKLVADAAPARVIAVVD